MAWFPSITTSGTNGAARHVLKLCRAEACQSMNAEAVAQRVLDHFDLDWGGTTPDGRLTVEATYCLGLCACAPIGDARRRADGAADTGLRRRDLARGGAVRIFVPRDAAARAVGADKVAAAIVDEAAQAGHRDRDRAHRFARPVLAGADGGGRDAGGPHRVRSGRTARRGEPGHRPLRQGSPAVPRPAGGAFLPRSARRASPSRAAESSIRCRSMTIARMAAGAGSNGRRASARRRRWKRSPSPACAAAAVQASRPASSGRPSPTRRPTRKYIVCNADEGDSGTYADRMIMEGDPFLLIEGMAIAGLFAVGATKGYVYIRSEYPDAACGPLCGARSSLSPVDGFEIEVRVGAGAYVCGEETSLLGVAGGQARPGTRQATAAGAQGPVRQADRDQQSDLARPPCRPSWLTAPSAMRRWAWALARHHADSAGRQRQVWRPVRGGVRPDAGRDRRGYRRRHA